MSTATRSLEGAWPGQIAALPAGITNRVGNLRRTPATPRGARICTFDGSGPCSGLDLSVPMFAPCLLGCPGTGRQDPVLTSLRLAGLRYSSARHSIPVTQVFKKVALSSGLLISGLGAGPLAAHRFGLRIYPFRVIFQHPICPRDGSMVARGFSRLAGGAVKSWFNRSRPMRICVSVTVTECKDHRQEPRESSGPPLGVPGTKVSAPPGMVPADLNQRVTPPADADDPGLIPVSPGLQFPCVIQERESILRVDDVRRASWRSS